MRKYTLSMQEYLAELKHASESKYAMLVSCAKQIDDNTVIIILEERS